MASLGGQQASGFSQGVLNIVRLLVIVVLGEYQARPVTAVHWEERQAGSSGVALALLLAPGLCFQLLRRNLWLHIQPLLLPLSPPGASTQLPDKHFAGNTCVLMILMSLISSLGVSVAVFSIFAVAVIIF